MSKVNSYGEDMEGQGFQILLLALFILGVGLSPVAVIGVWLLFYTDRALNVMFKAYDKLNIFGVKPYWDPQSSFYDSAYKIIGGLFILAYSLPLGILLLVIIWDLTDGQVKVCIFKC